MSDSTEDLDAYDEGSRAFFCGDDIMCNPYIGIEAEHWFDGWFDAKQDSEE